MWLFKIFGHLFYPLTNCDDTMIVEDIVCLQPTLTQMRGRLWCLSWRSWVTWATIRTLSTYWEPAPTEVSRHPESALLLSEHKMKLKGVSQPVWVRNHQRSFSQKSGNKECFILRTSACDHRVLQPGWPLELSSPEGRDVCKLGFEYSWAHGERQWLQKHLQPEVVH